MTDSFCLCSPSTWHTIPSTPNPSLKIKDSDFHRGWTQICGLTFGELWAEAKGLYTLEGRTVFHLLILVNRFLSAPTVNTHSSDLTCTYGRTVTTAVSVWNISSFSCGMNGQFGQRGGQCMEGVTSDRQGTTDWIGHGSLDTVLDCTRG